jgi:hypothetical protein
MALTSHCGKCERPSSTRRTFAARMAVPKAHLLLVREGTKLKKSLPHISVRAPNPPRRPLCATDRNGGSLMEPILYSLRARL